VNETPSRRNKAPFSNSNGVVWTRRWNQENLSTPVSFYFQSCKSAAPPSCVRVGSIPRNLKRIELLQSFTLFSYSELTNYRSSQSNNASHALRTVELFKSTYPVDNVVLQIRLDMRMCSYDSWMYSFHRFYKESLHKDRQL